MDCNFQQNVDSMSVKLSNIIILILLGVGYLLYQSDDFDGDFVGISLVSINEEGTILLKTRTEKEGRIAEEQTEYPVGHPEYKVVKEHVGELRVGEWRQVPPWMERPEK